MTSINEMNENSRVWTYMANRELSEKEVEIIKEKTADFITEWNYHGKLLHSAFGFYYNRILVLASDDSKVKVGGCGIEQSTNFMKELGQLLGVDFFQRTQVLYKSADGTLTEKPLHEFWAMRKAGLIDDKTMVIDSTVRTVGQLKNAFEVPFSESWHQEMWAR